MLKIGVFGAGHLGKIHLNLLKESKFYKIIGFYDSDIENSKKISNSLGFKSFNSPELLISNCDVIDIVTPTISHYELAIMAINNKCHVFIEKPIARNILQAKEIAKLAKLNNVFGQVGHVERFNAAYKIASSHIVNPMFIEAHRLAEFNPRGTDVPVVLDLMIHDIDIILSLVKSPIKSIKSSGVKVISNSPDIANSRIEFENGCVANLTSSRISMKNMRKSRFFQKDAYISIDFLTKDVEIVKMKDLTNKTAEMPMILENAEGIKKQIFFENPIIKKSNAILDELESFAISINNKSRPIVTLNDATEALIVAHKIIDSY